MSWTWHNGGKLPYLTIPKWQNAGIDLGFSTRLGGVSEVPYTSLNLGFHVGDDFDAVLENRKRWFEQWESSGFRVAVGEQVHGTRVIWVRDSDGGRGALEMETAIPAVDGLITQTSLGLMAFFADCVPLFFYYPDLKAVGVVHAGWKGTVDKIALRAIECFEDAGGCTENAWMGIGPSIGPCCYNVDQRVADHVYRNFSETLFLCPKGNGQYSFDLWEANRLMALEKGIRPENIDVARICTADNPEHFFSHRRDGGRTGRMAGWIRLRDEKES